MDLKRINAVSISLLIIFTLFPVILTSEAEARTLEVGTGYTYSKIQNAVDNATTGDEILIHQGTYYENILVNTRVTIRGESWEKVKIVSERTAITVHASSVVVKDVTAIGNMWGIQFARDADNCIVERCNLSHCDYGVYISGVDHTRINNTLFVENNFGLGSFRSTGTDIQFSTFTGDNTSIGSSYDTSWEASNNSFIDFNKEGMMIEDATDSYIGSNSFDVSAENSMNSTGIRVKECRGLTFEKNGLRNCGFLFEGITQLDWSDHTLKNNSINGLDILYEKSISSKVINSTYGQIILIDSTDVTIKDLNFMNCSYPVQIVNSKDLAITRSNFYNVQIGILLNNPEMAISDMVISQCKFHDIRSNGIKMACGQFDICRTKILDCEFKAIKEGYSTAIGGERSAIYGNKFSNNSVEQCANGYELKTSTMKWYWKEESNSFVNNEFKDVSGSCLNFYNVKDSIINNNSMANISSGIYHSVHHTSSGGYFHVNNNSITDTKIGICLGYIGLSTISNNTITNITKTIWQSPDSYGLKIFRGTRNVISNNTVMNGIVDGFVMTFQINNNTFRNNTIINCSRYGILYMGKDDHFHDNDLRGCGFKFLQNEIDQWLYNEIPDTNHVNGKRLVIESGLKKQVFSEDVGQILLHSSSNIEIRDLNLSSTSIGAGLYNCDNSTIKDCTFKVDFLGVENIGSSDIWIDNCMFVLNNYSGIVMDHMRSSSIRNNSLSRCGYPEFPGYPVFPEPSSGITIMQSERLFIENNTFTKCGIFLDDERATDIQMRSHDLRNNHVNGRDLVYLNGQNNKSISNSGQVILIECSDIDIRDQDLSYSAVGLTAYMSSDLNITNNILEWNLYGMTILSPTGDLGTINITGNRVSNNMIMGTNILCSDSSLCSRLEMTRNNFTNNHVHGIYAIDVSSVHINENDCSEHISNGIYIEISSAVASSNSTFVGNRVTYNSWRGICISNGNGSLIEGNVIEHNKYGIEIGASSARVQNNRLNFNYGGMWGTLEGSTVISNEIIGNSAFGLNLHGDHSSIYANRISGNDIGIGFRSGFSTFKLNIISENSGYGMVLSNPSGGCINNTIQFNHFQNNGGQGSQAEDDGEGNRWSLDGKGNYWYEHQSPDGNADGIVDTVYPIDGDAKSIDAYPLIIGNTPPLILPPFIGEAFEDRMFSVVFNAIDIEGDQVNWSIGTEFEFLEIGPLTGDLSGTPSDNDVGTGKVRVNATDMTGESSYFEFNLTVHNINDDPRIVSDDITSAYEDCPYLNRYEVMDIDPTDDILTMEMETNAPFLEFDHQEMILRGTPTQQEIGTYWIYLTLLDNRGGKDDRNFTLTVYEVNDVPRISGEPITSADEDEFIFMDFDGYDPDDPIENLVWSLSTDAEWMVFDGSNGTLSGTPGDCDIGTWSFDLSLSDLRGGTDHMEFTLIVKNINDPPVILTEDLPAARAGSPYHRVIEVSDDDIVDEHTFEITTNASFLSLDQMTGTLFGLPIENDVGWYFIEVTVTDLEGSKDTRSWDLRVLSENQKPEIIIGYRNISIVEDSTLFIDYEDLFLDPEDDELLFEAYPSSNLSCTLNEDNLSITPDLDWNGEGYIELSASDGKYTTILNLTIQIVPVNDAPVIVDVIHQNEYDEGSPQPASVIATDPDIVYGDSIKAVWSSNRTAGKMEGEQVDLSLPAGHHLITVEVVDSVGLKAQYSFSIIIHGISGDDDDENGDGNGKVNTFLIILLVIVAIIILTSILVFIMIIRNRKQLAKEKYEECQTGTPDEIAPVEETDLVPTSDANIDHTNPSDASNGSEIAEHPPMPDETAGSIDTPSIDQQMYSGEDPSQ
ncbi:MAG: right-handed parallel beta-helix repeat-containing protein [Candidatus Thermoplasmatota archaeon]|nr:right-handed parallel beta-helix repeat-containing protein [Candidatus Thermoplasmatota archaeon]